MPELLLELFSEEIPARMQSRASDDLKKLVTDALVDQGLVYEAARAFATPRRLTLVIDGLPVKQPDIKEERKGPRVGAPEKALEGFMRAAGLDDIAEAQIQSDKKGEFYVAVIEKTGAAAADVIADILPDIIRTFPWPKSMRWGGGDLKWVRPLRSLLCLFDGEVVDFSVENLSSGNLTTGHRFLGSDTVAVKDFETYDAALERAHVVLDPARRAEIILADAKDLCLVQGLDLIEDQALLSEAAGLVEWPVVLMGSFDAAFLDVPPEVVITSIKTHQKCFAVRDPKTGKLSNKFLLISNLIAEDGGQAIIAGNERVIAARLSDAKFFWDQDRKVKLADYAGKLGDIVFHEKLGTLADKVRRIEKLSGEIADVTGADKPGTAQAAQLCKADLVTNMVGEFPSLQGLMGRYYAVEENITPDVADAMAQHYQPLGPSDNLPDGPVGQTVALADKLDTLIGFWAIDEKPTGSKDPYALRRAALGIIRIMLEKQIRLHLAAPLARHLDSFRETLGEDFGDGFDEAGFNLFFVDRLKVYLRDNGLKHDLIDAVFSMENQDDIVTLVDRVEALNQFLKTDNGANLVAGYKRAVNIVRIEEKNDGPGIEYSGDVDPKFFELEEEKTLFAELSSARTRALEALEKQDFTAAMSAMAPLRGPVDAFFEAVIVNADSQIVRRNRLCLLNQIRATLARLADFSKLEG